METDYRLWRQYDDEWNQEEAWPEPQYPYATSRYMRKSGCFITSVAIMLRRYNIEQEKDPQRFNPLLLVKKMEEAGAYDLFADMYPEAISRLYPIEYLGTVPFSYQKLTEWMAKEEPCLVMVPGVSGPYHYVVPDEMDDRGVKICDPGFANEYLSEFDTAHYIVLFRKRSFLSNYTVKYFIGSIDGMEERCRELQIPVKDEYAERDILTKAFDTWGMEMTNHIPGNYVVVFRNTVQKKLFLCKSGEEETELYYYLCSNGKLLYGSEAYITSNEAYCAETDHSAIKRLTAGQCLEYTENPE